jgi:hypothetical protein
MTPLYPKTAGTVFARIDLLLHNLNQSATRQSHSVSSHFTNPPSTDSPHSCTLKSRNFDLAMVP